MTTAAQETNLKLLMEQSGTDVTTAFMVFQTPEGQWSATAELDDIIGGSSAVVVGCTAQQSAMTTLFLMEQKAQQQMQMIQQQQEAQKVASLIDPSKLRNPRA